MPDSTDAASESGGVNWILNQVFGDTDIELPPPTPEPIPPEEAPTREKPAWTPATSCWRCGMVKAESDGTFLSLTPHFTKRGKELMVCGDCVRVCVEWVLSQMGKWEAYDDGEVPP